MKHKKLEHLISYWGLLIMSFLVNDKLTGVALAFALISLILYYTDKE